MLLKTARRNLPRMSPTEREALDAGTVWIEASIFEGRPDWKRISADPWPELTAEERAFLDGPVEAVCAMVDEWELSKSRTLPEPVWELLRSERFFGLVIPRRYGGKEFSSLACSTICGKLASRSLPLSAVVLVPAATPGVEIGRHHDPMGVAFPNGPTSGRGVVVPAS